MAALQNTFLYEQCDVPPGMSLKQWRASVGTPRDRRRRDVLHRSRRRDRARGQ